jgi:hypothetical protein
MKTYVISAYQTIEIKNEETGSIHPQPAICLTEDAEYFMFHTFAEALDGRLPEATFAQKVETLQDLVSLLKGMSTEPIQLDFVDASCQG